MAEIKLTINGKNVTGELGDSVLTVCEKNYIDVPTLCHHKCLVDTGACRMCIVEIEGTRGYRPACSTEAIDGMVVKTDTEEVKKLRRTILEFLFSERNHFCPYCEVSGDCELQKLAYQHGIDHAKYRYALPQVRLDATRHYFVFDENRCILCQRCNRACSEIAGHSVLDLSKRGADASIIADLNIQFGESSCTSCGTCLQVCPTGALIDRKSSYLGRMYQCETTRSICLACSVGCGIEIVTRDNHVLKVNGNWDAKINKGILCVAGRFEQIYNDSKRLTKPMIKKNGSFVEASYDEALNYVAKKVKEAGLKNLVGVISPRATNKEANFFAYLIGNGKVAELGSSAISVSDPAKKATLNDVHQSDCILMYKTDLDKESRVIGSFVKIGVYHRDAKLITVDDADNSYNRHATRSLKTSEIEKAKEILDKALNPIIIFGSNTSAKEVETLTKLSGKAKLLGLLAGANSQGLHKLGVNGKVDVKNAKVVYVLACDDCLKEKFDRGSADFVVIQTSYLTPSAEKADVLLPSPIWSEKAGAITNIDGLVQTVAKTTETPECIQPNEAVIEALAGKMSS